MTDQLPVALLRPSHIRVLLVPIHPIRKDTFRQYVDTISEFAVVSTSDLTKPDSTKATSKFSQQMYEHDGYLHMNYVTFYDKDHAPLEEMQPWRQIVAVVGVMHCQQVTSIGEGGKRFQSILNRYPAVLASRCFAFEPTEQQADDTRGCIMIPDDPKKLSFYLQTQINDLANELLVAFGNMAAHAEKRPMINGPLLTSPLILPLSTSAAPSPIGNIASPSALHAAQSATSIIPSPHGASLPSAGVREASAPTLMPQDSASSMLGNIFAPDKTKKRTPARAQKIVGDLFLLAGRLDLAISRHDKEHFPIHCALEAMKAMADYQWQACTMESYYCALLLSLLSKTGAWPPPENNDNASFMSEDNALPALFTRQPLKPPTYATLFEAARINAQFRALICDIPERYREIVTLYEKACAPGQQGYYPHFQTQACLTIAKFLAAMWLNKFNGPITGGAGILLYTPESKGIADIATNMGLQPARQAGASASGGMGSSGPASDKDRIVLNGGLGCSRVDVSSWAMKAWGLGIEYLTLSDQIRCVTGITTAYALVGLRKKHAFFLRQTALLLAANLRGPQRARMGSLPDIAEAPDVKVGRATVTARGGPLESGSLLECMDIVCKAYGAGQLGGAADVDAPMALYDDENDDWVDAYFDESDLDLSSIDDPGAHRYIRPSAPLTRVRYGWPDLQISVLKETIEMAETVGAQAALVNAALRLLHRLHRNLSENEQHDVLDTLEAALGPQISLPSGSSTCRVPVLRRVEVLRQGLTEVPYPHPRGLLSGKVTAAADEKKDPFLYNPFADKGKSAKRDLGRSVLLVAGELAFFDVTFANPFLFDLDVDDLALHTSGVAFDPVPRPSAPIPAHARAHTIRLAGTPRESGTLEIRGVSARLFGGLRVEIECLSRLIENPKVRTKDGHRRPQDETARFGKRVTDLKPASKGDDAPLPPWSIPISVIPAQPVLQIVKDATGGGAQASRMLFAGERTAFPLRLENIGQTVVDFVTVGMLESYVEPAPGAAGAEMALEEPEDVYERDVHWRSVRALWVEKDPRRTAGSGGGGLAGGPPVLGEAVVERLDMRLAPGESADVWIGVFGKLGCTGGTITVSYASTDASPPDSPTFHTRVLVQPVHVTVTRSLHPLTMDVLLLTDRRDFIGSTEEGAGGQHRDMSLEELTVDVGGEEDEREDSEKRQKDDYCLFVLDLRNFWRGVFEVVFEVFDDPESVVPSYETRTVIHSGVTKRIHLPVRRLLLPASQASQRIPEPSWKQFVVGKTRKRAPREEHARRTWFWYREELLRRVRVRWHASGNRAGTVPLRALKLGPEMGAALRQQRVAVDVDVAGKAAAGPTRWTLKVWEEVTLVWTVRNMTDRQLLPLLRVLPTRNPPPLTSGATPAITTSSSPAGVSLSPRQVSAAATNVIPAAPLTAVLPPVPPGSSVSHTLPLLATGSGAVCFLWTVEDLDAADAAAGEGAWCGGEDAVLTVI